MAACVADRLFYHRMGDTLDYDPQFILNWVPRADTQLNIARAFPLLPSTSDLTVTFSVVSHSENVIWSSGSSR